MGRPLIVHAVADPADVVITPRTGIASAGSVPGRTVRGAAWRWGLLLGLGWLIQAGLRMWFDPTAFTDSIEQLSHQAIAKLGKVL